MKLLLAGVLLAASLSVSARGAPLGTDVEGLLAYAHNRNPELTAMRFEAEAAAERVHPAGALPDPVFRTELRDVTNYGMDASSNLLPARIGSTRYLLMQSVPWFGKRDLKREAAAAEAEAAGGRAAATWNELATRIKATYAQYYYAVRSEQLTREIIDLMARLEKIAQVRYAGGLGAQQDAIRAQVEQTGMKSELVALGNERHHLHTRLNTLLSRGAQEPLAEPAALRALPAPARLDYLALEERARGRNPQLSTEEARVRAAENMRELTYRNRYPDFTLGVSPIQVGKSVREWEVMVELNIPLQQDSRRAQEREAEAMLAAARARREAQANQVLADLSENLSGLEAARRTENLLATSLLPQAELTFRAALAGYETGKLDFATLLDAQRQIRKARQDLLKAQVEARLRLADIERIVGEDL